MVIGGHESTRDLKAFLSPMNLQFNCLNSTDPLSISLQSELNKDDIPFFMIVQSNLEVIFPYIRDNKDQNEKYLDRVIQYFIDTEKN